MRYKIIFDDGKPYEVDVNTDQELKNELRSFYIQNKDDDYEYDCQVLELQEHTKELIDISESQFIEEMIGEIIE